MSFITRPVSRTLSPVLGFLLGTSKPPKLQAQMLGELADQTAKEGEPRPIVFGIGRPIGGNVMYQSQPIRKMVKTYVGKSGGKGGSSKKKKQYQDVEHVYRYYAIRVCEGPITGFRRIWRNGALVYDARKGSEWGARNNHLFFNTFRLYDGSWTQMPDPTLQSMLRDTDIPAFRGTAYLVAINEDLTELGGAIPKWQFEVARSEGYHVTSRPYAVESMDAANASLSASIELVRPPAGLDAAGDIDFSVTANLRTLRVDYDNDSVPAAGGLTMSFDANLKGIIAPEDGGQVDYSAEIETRRQTIIASVDPESTAAEYNAEINLENK